LLVVRGSLGALIEQDVGLAKTKLIGHQRSIIRFIVEDDKFTILLARNCYGGNQKYLMTDLLGIDMNFKQSYKAL
jgi:hypothetical protein